METRDTSFLISRKYHKRHKDNRPNHGRVPTFDAGQLRRLQISRLRHEIGLWMQFSCCKCRFVASFFRFRLTFSKHGSVIILSAMGNPEKFPEKMRQFGAATAFPLICVYRMLVPISKANSSKTSVIPWELLKFHL